MKSSLLFLEHIAYQLRVSSIRMTTHAGSGHVTSCLSAADIMAALFFHTMSYDPKHMHNSNNDRFILSKGHAAPLLYAVWKEVGVVTEAQLMTYRQFGSPLEGHPTPRFAYAEAATGSLGMGLSIGVGQALAGKQGKHSYKTYVLLGDGEMAEGSVWEALQLAAFYKLDNIVGIIDCNRLGQSGPTMEALEGDAPERFKKMVESFGWLGLIVDGNDMQALVRTLDQARACAMPVMIIAITKKGYGIDFMEDKEGYHGKPVPQNELEPVLAAMKQRFSRAASFKPNERWHPKIPNDSHPIEKKKSASIAAPTYAIGQSIATRRAYGDVLCALGDVLPQLISLDAEVKNSTFAELFEHEYPARFYQCFIAEQNMIGMAIGFEKRGKIPFVSTFGVFFTRAYDQIRMAAIGDAALRLVGSHAGVSIGQDGPSQMALEDIAMMVPILDAVVLYPSDAMSTYFLAVEMAGYSAGISYLRTTRMATPVIYNSSEKFTIGGCKVVRQSKADKVCIIGAGVTLHEALKAHDALKKEGIAVAVIDLYSIKPIDAKTIRAVARAAGNKIITVEDHYLQGGLGSAVIDAVCNDGFTITRLAVNQMPGSGTPQELLAQMGIDAAGIIKAVKKII